MNFKLIINKNSNVYVSLLEKGLRDVLKVTLIIIFNILYFSNSFSQTITHGPIVGAVTDTSAKLLYLNTDKIYYKKKYSFKNGFEQIELPMLVVYMDSLESSLKRYYSDKNTDLFNDVEGYYLDTFFYVDTSFLKMRILSFDKSSGINLTLKNLIPNSVYHYRITCEDEEYTGSFKTFPSAKDTSHFSFVLGSCTEQHHNDSIFVEMRKHNPAFFLHLGDWLYTNNFKEEKFYYNESLDHQKELYQKRYEMPNLKEFIKTTPIDFVFDDEDGVYDDFSKHSYTELKMNGKETSIKEIPYPDSLRKNAIAGYKQFFPNYNEIENQVYHSFVYGNAEIIFLDTRSTRSPNTESFHLSKNGKWKYKVPKGHEILDSAQMNWLLRKLENSTAQWKFIVSGVTFNQSYKKVLDICLRAQKRILPNGMNGSYVAASLASMWFAFPESQTQLLNFCHDKNIKNVIVLSGDAHTAAIDDGANAGFPELMAGGLAQKNSKLASIIKNNLQLNLWNQGGQGIGNTNFNDAFGKIEVNGNSSVKLTCIDKYGNEICNYKVENGFIPKKYILKPRTKIKRVRALKNLLRIAIHK